MFLCSDGHDEVAHENHGCPVCEKMVEIEQLEEEIKTLTARVESLEEENNDLREGENI